MKMADRIKQAVKRFQQISLSSLFVILVSVIVMITSVVSLLIFVNLYRNDMEQNAITTSEQARCTGEKYRFQLYRRHERYHADDLC